MHWNVHCMCTGICTAAGTGRALFSKGKTPNLLSGVLNKNAHVGAILTCLHRCPPAPPISRLMISPSGVWKCGRFF